MINSLFFKQSKPLTVKILGAAILILLAFIMLGGGVSLSQIISMFVIGFVLVGYSISYEFSKDYSNKKHFKLFGFTLFRFELDVIFPDYISVFAASFKQDATWGPIAALGKQLEDKSYVIRLFKGRQHFTLFKTDSLIIAKDKATSLAALLEVKLIVKN